MDDTHLPANKLDPKVKTAWRLQAVAAWVLPVIAAIVFAAVAPVLGLPPWIPLLVGAVVLGGVVLWLTAVPEVQYRRWRWEVADEEIRLQTGLIVRTRTVIPMVRVQHVDTSQGPIMRALGLSDVHVWTAAGKHAIPALAEADAQRLRDRIAVLARVSDDGGL